MPKILIVDDAAFMRITLSSILEKEGFEIVGKAENGKEAVELYKKERPDLVTMDITMPIMNGIEAIKEICLFDPKDFIVKPFDESRVIETIRNVLEMN